MIFDGENLFFDKKTLSSGSMTSDILDVGPGEASDNMHLVVNVNTTETTGTISFALETADDEDFTTPVQLGAYSGVPLSTKLPRGNKGFLRLTAKNTIASGTITAGLVLDDNVSYIPDVKTYGTSITLP
jgi:hypothetical protein